MRNLLIILSLSFLVQNSYATAYIDVYGALLTDAELRLEGKSNVSLDSLVIVTNEAASLMQKVDAEEITDEQAVLGVIDIYGDIEGLYCEHLAQTIQQYNTERIAILDSTLVTRCRTMECRMQEFKKEGWPIPQRIQEKYDDLVYQISQNSRLVKKERKRILRQKESMVEHRTIDGVNYQIISLQNKLFDIHVYAFGGEHLFWQSGFCPPNRPHHTALDGSQGLFSKVRSMTAGYVTNRYDAYLGKYATVYSPYLDMTFIYAHLNNFTVANGSWVEAGTVIGREGYTGRVKPSCADCKGNHTHVIGIEGEWKGKLSNFVNIEYMFPGFKKGRLFDGAIAKKLYLKETNGKHGQWEAISSEEYHNALEKELSLN